MRMSENKLNENEVFEQKADDAELEQVTGGASEKNWCRYGYVAPVKHEEPAAPAAPEPAVVVEPVQPVVVSDADLPKNLKLPESSGVKID